MSDYNIITLYYYLIIAVLQREVEAAQLKKLSLVDAFKKLVIKMKSVLKKRGESVDEFRDSFLLSLNAFEKERHYHFFNHRKTAICDSTTYDELFLVLDFYWDYLNYHLLECLVREYGDKYAKSHMKEYLEDVSTFMETTTLQVFWEIEPCLKSVPPPGFTETVVKHNQDISVESTLKDVENIRTSLANEIQLSKYAILLSTIQEGCIQITWFTVFHCEMTSKSLA